MTQDRPRAGQVAIVTGGAKGIGAVVADCLAEDGAHIALVARNEQALRAKAAALDEKFPGRESLAVPCDVTDEQQVRAMVEAVADRFSGLHIPVNTAGGNGPARNPTPHEPTRESLRDFRS